VAQGACRAGVRGESRHAAVRRGRRRADAAVRVSCWQHRDGTGLDALDTCHSQVIWP
jgi:hypothetical protein